MLNTPHTKRSLFKDSRTNDWERAVSRITTLLSSSIVNIFYQSRVSYTSQSN